MKLRFCVLNGSIEFRKYLCNVFLVIFVDAAVRAVPQHLQAIEDAICTLSCKPFKSLLGGLVLEAGILIHNHRLLLLYKYVKPLQGGYLDCNRLS